MPGAKYKCVELEGNCDTMSLQVEGAALTNDGEHIFDISRVESAKDSNNIADDSDTAMSACVDVNYGFGHAMRKDIASTSAKWPDCDYPQGMLFSSDGTKELISESSGRNSDVVLGCHGESSHECGLQMRQMLEEQLVEFGVDLTYGCSDYANACQERRANEEVEDCNLSSGLESTNFILSSGKSSVDNGKSHCLPWLAVFHPYKLTFINAYCY